MDWVRRLLTDTEDDGRFRSGLGVVMGVCIATLPLLFGMMDAQTFLIATLIGAISVAPFWRYVGEPLSRPFSIIAFMSFLIAMVIVLRQLPGVAYFAFCGRMGVHARIDALREWMAEPGAIRPGS